MRFTAKVKVQTNEPYENGTNQIVFVPDYNDGRNVEWSKWTPSLSLSMNVREELGQEIKIGDAYTLTFDNENG